MDCTKEKLEKINVFQLKILIPLIKILDVYMAVKDRLSPDEFCIFLFAQEETEEKCKLDCNPIKHYFDNLEDFKIATVEVQNIIVDLFMHIIRYELFLKEISEDFLIKQNSCNCNDLHQIMVLIYALVYKIFNLYFEDSLDCFIHFKLRKMLLLVTYLLGSETSNLFHQKGCNVFDENFVEQKLVLPLLEGTPYLEKLRDHLKSAIEKMKIPKKKNTVPILMNVLNRHKPGLNAPPPSPDDSLVVKFAREIPRTNYVKPSTETKLESLRATNKLHAMNLLKDANEKAPRCLQRRKYSVKTTKEESKVVFVRKSAPTFKPVEIKQTTASILRECARVVSDEKKELEKLKELTEGRPDPSLIQKLEEQVRQQKKEAELQKIQEKRLLALLSHEDALIAKQSLLNDIKLHGENVRKEKQKLNDILEKWKQNNKKEMLEIVEKCRGIEQSSREAFNAMIDEKRQKAAEVSEESRKLKARLIKERESETQRKIKMIQQMRAIQSLQASPRKNFDPTESSGLGLLCEMSLTELKERLFWMKMKFNEEAEDRKNFVQRERKRQKNTIKSVQQALEKYKANKLERCVESSSKSQQNAIPISSPEIDVLRKELEERKALRLQKQSTYRLK